MTTPAVNTQGFIKDVYMRCIEWTPGVPSCIPFDVPQAGYYSEVRPASSSIPFLDNGWRSVGPWSHFGVRGRLGKGKIAYNDHGYRVEATGTILQYAEWQRARYVSGNTKSAAYTKALAAAAENKAQLGAFFAEIDKTLGMLARAIRTVERSIVYFRRRRPRDWLEVLKWQVPNRAGTNRALWCKIPSAWLEVQYGWKPVMGDVSGAINAIAEAASKRVPVISAVGTHRDTYPVSLHLSAAAGWGTVPLPTINLSMVERARVELWFGISNPTFHTLGELGMINPAGIVWELLPYSFVVDWFLPIGTWLEACTAPAGLDFIDGCSSQVVESKDAVLSPRPFGGPTVYEWFPPSVDHHEKHFVREKVGLTVPGFYVKSPLSVGHVANALSLLATSMTRRV